MLAASYVISKSPEGLKRLTVSDSPASMELWVVGTNALLAGFPDTFCETVKRNELVTDSEEYLATESEYQQVIQQFNENTCAQRNLGRMNLIGPSEFNATGTLATWTVIADLHRISVPTLFQVSTDPGATTRHRMLQSPPFFEWIPKVKWVQFAKSSHMPFSKEKERYLQVGGDFLARDN